MVPTALLWLNGLFFVALAAATVARILRYPQAFAADIANHGRGVGFFTTVAGTAALGTQLFVQIKGAGIAAGLSEAACAGEGQRINHQWRIAHSGGGAGLRRVAEKTRAISFRSGLAGFPFDKSG